MGLLILFIIANPISEALSAASLSPPVPITGDPKTIRRSGVLWRLWAENPAASSQTRSLKLLNSVS
jgi:hypothetical protein